MRIITYNIWNSDNYFKIRLEQLCKVLINCDYIMLKSQYLKENPILNSVNIIGDIRELQITPSDQYGVMCDIDFV